MTCLVRNRSYQRLVYAKPPGKAGERIETFEIPPNAEVQDIPSWVRAHKGYQRDRVREVRTTDRDGNQFRGPALTLVHGSDAPDAEPAKKVA